MDPKRNPFVPSAGANPPELAGREAILDMADVLLDRTKEGRIGRNFIMYGLRGVGKTVLLVKIDQLAEERGYSVVHLEGGEGQSVNPRFAQELRQILLSMPSASGVVGKKLRHSIGVLLSYLEMLKISTNNINIEIKPNHGIADTGDIAEDISALLLAVAEAAKESNKCIAISIDEIHTIPDKELEGIIVALHRIQQKNLPLVVYGAGLPTILSKVGKIKTYAERLFDYPQINALTEEETYSALQIPIQKEGGGYTLNALKQIYTWSAGYPYFIQVWGKVTWDEAPSAQITEDTVRACRDRVTTDLDNGFYRVRYEQLTNKEKQYIKAMAELGTGSQSSLDIAKHIKKSLAAVSVIRGKLISKGVIYSPEYKKLAFTVPLFDEFVRRNM